jgi:predicted nucleic acid-binding protein
MRIIINDANILIDLVHLVLMDQFVLLELELKVTDFVFEELNAEQKNIIINYIEEGYIELIITDNEEDYVRISNILAKNSGLSFEDCTVWHYAEKLNGILLTGDGKLRKQATENGIEVKGIFYIFDELLSAKLITFDEAIDKIELLYSINTRLPQDAKKERILKWKKKEHIR